MAKSDTRPLASTCACSDGESGVEHKTGLFYKIAIIEWYISPLPLPQTVIGSSAATLCCQPSFACPPLTTISEVDSVLPILIFPSSFVSHSPENSPFDYPPFSNGQKKELS